MPPEDENPFENRPMEVDRRRRNLPPPPSETPVRPPPAVPRVNPFEGKASWDVEKKPAVRATAPEAVRARVAMGAGFGIIFGIGLFYVSVGLLTNFDFRATLLGLAGMAIAAVAPYLLMAEQMPSEKRTLHPISRKFLSGALIAGLALILFGVLAIFPGQWTVALLLLVAIVLTWVAVTLFLYSLYGGPRPPTRPPATVLPPPRRIP